VKKRDTDRALFGHLLAPRSVLGVGRDVEAGLQLWLMLRHARNPDAHDRELMQRLHVV